MRVRRCCRAGSGARRARVCTRRPGAGGPRARLSGAGWSALLLLLLLLRLLLLLLLLLGLRLRLLLLRLLLPCYLKLRQFRGALRGAAFASPFRAAQ